MDTNGEFGLFLKVFYVEKFFSFFCNLTSCCTAWSLGGGRMVVVRSSYCRVSLFGTSVGSVGNGFSGTFRDFKEE